MSSNKIEKFIDSRNKNLWEELNNHFSINFIEHDKGYAEVFSKSQVADIYVNPIETDADSFTHELLHLLLEKREIYIGTTIQMWAQDNPKLKKIFCKELLVHIGNTCEHVKIYPKYLSLGFSPDNFLHDNDEHKCSEKSISEIENYFRYLWWYRAKAIEVYIGKFFAIKADHNESFDYRDCDKRLRKVDAKLYKILNDFWNAWLNYDVDKPDVVPNSYHEIAFEFFDNFEKWIKRKLLI